MVPSALDRRRRSGMANQLKMAVVNAIVTLMQLGWSQGRIARALSIDRETAALTISRCSAMVPPPMLHRATDAGSRSIVAYGKGKTPVWSHGDVSTFKATG
jgi:hypothetical protein